MEAQARVDKWIEHYRSSPENIATITERATPWLAWITQQVSERGLPGEVALIPFVESSFDPGAQATAALPAYGSLCRAQVMHWGWYATVTTMVALM
ncbi:hypothetical protein HSBAA_34250 [Vreelandella sulfidaeris]|uniref:Uncharacterized protein n=1 Tax=Vreelandella sulfidaeris TaxID=115553 RepID=A0A455UCE7_9GAMM|nr:hypothetical protein HSBAA_34250 [Halomonas sulfidaeris]